MEVLPGFLNLQYEGFDEETPPPTTPPGEDPHTPTPQDEQECDPEETVTAGRCTPDGHLILCGDGRVDGHEQCDDGNLINGDECNDLCYWERGRGTCGNGELDPWEECDDGNLEDGDSCSAFCIAVQASEETGKAPQ